MKLTVIGYLGGYPDHGMATSSYLLGADNYHMLIDCGSGALLSLEEIFDPLKLDSVIITHYHNDHIADLGVLEYYWQLHTKRYDQKILPIYGHDFDSEHFSELDWPNSTKAVAYDPNRQLAVGPFDIRFFKTEHLVTAYALRITERKTGKVLVFTADTRYFKELTGFCKNADLLMADTNFFADKDGTKWHMTSTESATLAKDAGVKKLLLTHLPADGDLNQLKQEATSVLDAKTPILLASKHLSIQL
mgnify:FL=1